MCSLAGSPGQHSPFLREFSLLNTVSYCFRRFCFRGSCQTSIAHLGSSCLSILWWDTWVMMVQFFVDCMCCNDGSIFCRYRSWDLRWSCTFWGVRLYSSDLFWLGIAKFSFFEVIVSALIYNACFSLFIIFSFPSFLSSHLHLDYSLLLVLGCLFGHKWNLAMFWYRCRKLVDVEKMRAAEGSVSSPHERLVFSDTNWFIINWTRDHSLQSTQS